MIKMFFHSYWYVKLPEGNPKKKKLRTSRGYKCLLQFCFQFLRIGFAVISFLGMVHRMIHGGKMVGEWLAHGLILRRVFHCDECVIVFSVSLLWR